MCPCLNGVLKKKKIKTQQNSPKYHQGILNFLGIGFIFYFIDLLLSPSHNHDDGEENNGELTTLTIMDKDSVRVCSESSHRIIMINDFASC